MNIFSKYSWIIFESWAPRKCHPATKMSKNWMNPIPQALGPKVSSKLTNKKSENGWNVSGRADVGGHYGSLSKNLDIETTLVVSFFAGSYYSFFATSGVLVSGFFEELSSYFNIFCWNNFYNRLFESPRTVIQSKINGLNFKRVYFGIIFSPIWWYN